MKATPPFLRLKPGFDLALGKVLLTGVVADPSSTRNTKHPLYKNLSVKTHSTKHIEKNDSGGPKMSKPASTMFSAKLRHGLAWHPSLPNHCMYKLYINLS